MAFEELVMHRRIAALADQPARIDQPAAEIGLIEIVFIFLIKAAN